MSTQVTLPVISNVSALEALRSGTSTDTRKLNPQQRKTLLSFISAHRAKNPEATEHKTANGGLANSQVSAVEQASSVALRGYSGLTRKDEKSKSRSLYEALFTEDEGFLKLDLDTFLQSLTTEKVGTLSTPGSTKIALVDITKNLRPEDRQLRKFLLSKIALEDPVIEKSLKSQINQFLSGLGREDLNYITDTMVAFETGKALGKAHLKAKLRDFIKAYQALNIEVDSKDKETKTTEILDMFRTLKPRVQNKNFVKEFSVTLDGLFKVLTREKTQYPCRITSARQFKILSRIKILAVLIKLVIAHNKFYGFCKNAGIEGLPEMGNLIENSLQYMASGEAYAGINMLVQMASNVMSEKPHAKAMVMNMYRKMVLLDPAAHNLYWSAEIQLKLNDALDKSIKSAGINNLAKAA